MIRPTVAAMSKGASTGPKSLEWSGLKEMPPMTQTSRWKDMAVRTTDASGREGSWPHAAIGGWLECGAGQEGDLTDAELPDAAPPAGCPTQPGGGA